MYVELEEDGVACLMAKTEDPEQDIGSVLVAMRTCSVSVEGGIAQEVANMPDRRVLMVPVEEAGY